MGGESWNLILTQVICFFNMNKLTFFFTCFLYFYAAVANAVISIDITRGNIDPLPIALPPLSGSDTATNQLGQKVMGVVKADLERSGLFRSIDERAFIQKFNGVNTIPIFSDWRKINAQAVATGGITLLANNKFTSEFRLWDVLAEQQISGKSFTTNVANERRVGHLIADQIYKRLTGEEGYFDTRIVYIAESGPPRKKIKQLAIMDQDGANHRYLTNGADLVLTPRFSPTLQEIIYLSYKNNDPKVYIKNVDTGAEKLVGKFPGMTFSPRFAPNGKSVIMSAAHNGNTDIYTFDLRTRKKQRLTTNSAIDTSPSFSPDGKYVTFNSDRAGSQQLYTMDAHGNNVKRISFGSGKYATPVWSPRGDLIAFTKISNGKFYIGVMKPDGTSERLLTESFLDEGPSWAPNGRVIIFARQTPSYKGRLGQWSIYSIDLTGYNEYKVPTPLEASDPAWSPLL